MWKVIDYLKDPYLVVYVQNYFGVRSSKDLKHLRSNKSSSERNVNKSNQNANGLHQENKKHSSHIFQNSDTLLNEIKNVIDEPFSSESETEIKDYVVTNWFWYYLFVFGTLLGDEVFYASFIPFWFWNIDGAVGRRIVMVWAIIMYIGMYILHSFLIIHVTLFGLQILFSGVQTNPCTLLSTNMAISKKPS